MADSPAAIEIPNRALFKAAEVCELMKVQPYVLRTWEAEFPELGVAKSAGAACDGAAATFDAFDERPSPSVAVT